jgi:proteasome lid subunit RPN8/RPN11
MNESKIKVLQTRRRHGELTKPRFDFLEGFIVWGIPDDSHVKIVIKYSAYESFMKHSLSKNHSEVGGLLIGEVYKDENHYYVQIDESEPDYNGIGEPASYVFTNESWMNLVKCIENKYPSKRIVGWYHSHPGYSAFFSPTDVKSHQTYFNQPWMIGLVIDPIKNEGIFYCTPPDHNRPIKIREFYEGLPEESRISYIKWRNWVRYFPVRDTERHVLENGNEQTREPMPAIPDKTKDKNVLIKKSDYIIMASSFFGMIFLIMTLWTFTRISQLENQLLTLQNDYQNLRLQFLISENNNKIIEDKVNKTESVVREFSENKTNGNLQFLGGSRNLLFYIVKEGESISEILQKYSLDSNNFYMLNNPPPDLAEITPGNLLIFVNP